LPQVRLTQDVWQVLSKNNRSYAPADFKICKYEGWFSGTNAASGGRQMNIDAPCARAKVTP
jgi:hypothetical protein